MSKEEKKNHVDMTKMSVKELRQRLFVKRSEVLYGIKEYSYPDDVPEQIEKLPGFHNWESFSETWDVYWVGLDPRTLNWEVGRHNSPMRMVVSPVRILPIDQRSGRMQDSFLDKADVRKIEVPFTEPLPETDEDRIISESLSGKVVVDETDENKAIRMIEENMRILQEQLETLIKSKK